MQKKQNEFENKESRTGMKVNAWKRYGAFAMAGFLMAGVAFTGAITSGVAEAKDGVTLNIAGEDQAEETEEVTEAATETVTEAAEEETEETEQETFADINKVSTGDSLATAIDISGVVEECMPSIVSITNKMTEQIPGFYGIQEYEAECAASGIIIAQTDTELLIATNSHVVADKDENYVWFTVDVENEEDAKVPVKVKGMDKTSELAVLAVELKDIPKDVLSQIKIAELGSSDDLKVGQTAISIGNELGYGQSVTCGVISALNRECDLDDFSGELILMDTTINFGSSGGAVLNTKGQVIGINVAKEAGSGSEGMAYAIPIDYAIPVLQRLADRETRDKLDSSERGYMGATVVNVSADAMDLYNMPRGAFVYEVAEDSAAEKAGIKKGDIITKFDGETVLSHEDLIEKMSFYDVGETVTVEVMTSNNGEYESREVEITLQEGSKTEEEDAEKSEESFYEDDNTEEFIPDDNSYGINGHQIEDYPGLEDYLRDYFNDNGGMPDEFENLFGNGLF